MAAAAHGMALQGLKLFEQRLGSVVQHRNGGDCLTLHIPWDARHEPSKKR